MVWHFTSLIFLAAENGEMSRGKKRFKIIAGKLVLLYRGAGYRQRQTVPPRQIYILVVLQHGNYFNL
jgi:hypothetical protein